MHSIIHLVNKDFISSRRYHILSLVLLFCMSTVYISILLNGAEQLEPVLVMYTIMVGLSSSIVSLIFLTQDEMHKTDAFFVSLPVSRGQVITAKFSSSYIQLLLAVLVHFLGFQLGLLFASNYVSEELRQVINPMYWFTILYVLLLFKCYSYPLYFKFGLGVGALVHGVIQILLIILLILSVKMFNFSEVINGTMQWILGQNRGLMFAGFITALVFLKGASLLLSIRMFKNKNI